MGLALLDVADVIRPYPEVIEYLQHVREDNFLDNLVTFHGGQEARETAKLPSISLSNSNQAGWRRCIGSHFPALR